MDGHYLNLSAKNINLFLREPLLLKGVKMDRFRQEFNF